MFTPFEWAALGNMAVNAAGAVRGFMQSSNTSPTWGDLNKTAAVQDYWNRGAEARQVANSKDLFAYQNLFGPRFRVKGLQQAGINPVLAGDYSGGAMPTVGASQVSTNVNSMSKIDKARNFFQLAESLQAIRESESRVEANQANASNLIERSETENALRDYRKALAFYKTVNESQVPLKLKAYLQSQAIMNVVNTGRVFLMASQQGVNAKQAMYYDAMKDYWKWKKDHSDRIGYNNTYINYNIGDVLHWLGEASNPWGLLRGVGARIGQGMVGVTPEHD